MNSGNNTRDNNVIVEITAPA
ncbi:hypothetical protein MPC1_3590001 [Methylocella tundrae]|nr:hypothetical protein MPC1_3590001 [Methylocella tundrae]